jgi:hypothetical protein
VIKGKAEASITGRYTQPGAPRGEAQLRLTINSLGPETGGPVNCGTQIELVPVAGRVGGGLVSGTLSERLIALSFTLGQGKAGAWGFPLDRLAAGKSFTVSLKGKSVLRKEDLEATKQGRVTAGSTRLVFTPRARARAAARRPSAAAATCAATPPEWWSKKQRACFSINASAQWRNVASWTTDENGQPCKGSDTRSMSWTSPPTTFWVGDSFPVGYSARRWRTHNIFDGLSIKAKLSRHVSGGVREAGCVPMLKKDCGTRTATFRDVSVIFFTIDGSYAYVPGTPTTIAPFRACGSVAGEGAFSLSGPGEARGWGGFVPFPIPAANSEDLEKRLLKVRVGGSLVLRGTGGPYPYNPGSGAAKETGSFTGKLVFKRVK